jgi:hypothetical protein
MLFSPRLANYRRGGKFFSLSHRTISGHQLSFDDSVTQSSPSRSALPLNWEFRFYEMIDEAICVSALAV